MAIVDDMGVIRFDEPLTLYSSEGVRVTSAIFGILLIDDSRGRKVVARLPPAPRGIVLWKGEEYDAVGDYTQAQAEQRILELLIGDPAKILGYDPPASSSSSSAGQA